MRRRQAATRPVTALGLAALSGAIYALAQPPVGLWPLAFCFLPPLWVALGGRSVWARAGLGWAAGALAGMLCVTGPVARAVSGYFGLPDGQAVAAGLLAGQVFGGIGFAVFGVLAGDPARQRVMVSLPRAAAAFVSGELLRTYLLTGLPWLLLAHALAPAPALAQLAAFGGSSLVTFFMALLGLALFQLARRGDRVAAGLAATAVACALLAFLAQPETHGQLRPALGKRPDDALRFALVQPAASGAWSDPVAVAEHVGRLAALSRRAPRADVVVWPENSVGLPLPGNRGLIRNALVDWRGSDTAFLVGAPHYDASQPGRLFNAALLVDPSGAVIAAHDKVHLVPFTEYVPWPLRALGFDGPALSAGARPVTLPVGDHRVGPLVCYELLFPALARAQVRAGAGVLVNLSTDAWFGDTGGAEQHLTAAVLRAIELRRPLLRVSTSGITVAIDAAGRRIAELPRGEPGVLELDVVPAEGLSLYALAGDLWAWLAFAALCGLLLARR